MGSKRRRPRELDLAQRLSNIYLTHALRPSCLKIHASWWQWCGHARTESSLRSRRTTGIGWSRVDAIADSRCEIWEMQKLQMGLDTRHLRCGGRESGGVTFVTVNITKIILPATGGFGLSRTTRRHLYATECTSTLHTKHDSPAYAQIARR